MKKFRVIIATVLFCAVGYTGYTTYERMTMTEAEKFMLQNIEALTNDGETDLNVSCFRNCWQDYRYNCTIILSEVLTGEVLLEFTCEYFKKPFGI